MVISSKNLNWTYYLGAFFIFLGFALTFVSALKICTGMCNEAHNYRMFTMPFEIPGIFYFTALAIFHYLGKTYSKVLKWNFFLILLGLGSEAFFIFLQKYEIGAWCPVCLSIAASIGLLGLCYLILLKGENMFRWLQTSLMVTVFAVGFGTAFIGVSKIDQLQATEDAIKEKIKFGDTKSKIEVFVFTDWACPACHHIEPTLESVSPKIMKEAQLTFVDTVVHPETLNYAPYNIAFMVQNKPKYFEIRNALTKLSLTNKKPTDQDVEKAVSPLGVKLKELPYGDVTACMKYFDELKTKYKIKGTPTIAIINRDTKKGKKYSGSEISETNILEGIKALK